MSDGSFSAGEIGGIFAGIVSLLVTFGGGIRWLLGWKERRAQTLHAKLLRWEEKLNEREARLDAEQIGYIAKIEGRLARLEQQQEALRDSYQIVSTELRVKDPENLRLRFAEARLRAAFPDDTLFKIEPIVPADMTATLGKLPKE